VTEDEYSALMKKALTNELHWHGLTATPPEAQQARDWLEDTLSRVKRDFEVRKAEWNLVTAREMRGSKAYRRELERYELWKISAIRFRNLCEDRLRELKRSHLVRGGNAKPAAVTKAQAHSEYMNRQLHHTSTSLVKLAEAVATFEQGDMSPRDLASCLDDLTVPHGGDGEKTLRELLAETRKKRLEIVS
jgi:hypothetical protein